jgi:hypothetical protein
MARYRDMTTTRGDWTTAVIPIGVLMALLGAWAFFVPLVGPYFGFGFHTDETWVFSEPNWTLSLAPGLAVMVAGLGMVIPNRVARWVFGMLGLLGGAWLVLGPSLYSLWNPGDQIQPISASETASETTTALLWIGYYYGVGALVIFLSGLAEGLVAGRARVRVVATSTDAEPVTEPVATADESERPLIVR